MRQVFHVPCRPPTGILDQDARRLGVDPPAFLKGLVAPSVFMQFSVGLRAGHAGERNKGERLSLPASATTPVLLLPLLQVHGLPDIAAAVVEEQAVEMSGAGQVFLVAFPDQGSSINGYTYIPIEENPGSSRGSTNKGPEGPLPRSITSLVHHAIV